MNREQLIETYGKIVLRESDRVEWIICSLIWTALRKGERGSISHAKTHLWARKRGLTTAA